MGIRKVRLAVCGNCYFPNEKYGQDQERGERFECKCGARYICGETYDGTIYYFIMKRGDIAPDQAGLWQLEMSKGKRHVYVTCPNCARIDELRLGEVDSEGYVGGEGTCISCNCGNHYWPYLEGWKRKSSKVKSKG